MAMPQVERCTRLLEQNWWGKTMENHPDPRVHHIIFLLKIAMYDHRLSGAYSIFSHI